jgi:hypothetical protein
MRAPGTNVLVFVLTVWSLATIGIDSISRPNREIAERLEAGAKRDEGYFARIDGLHAAEGMLVCPRELVRSAATINLAKLDAISRSGREAPWTMALADAGAVVREGLRCFPYDGNLWLRLAILEFSLSGPTRPVGQMLELSALMAPSEGWILAPRIGLAARVLDFQSSGVSVVLRKDIGVLVQYGQLSDVAALYLQVGGAARQVFDESFAELDNKRRSAVDEAIASIVKTLPSERRP